MTAAWVELVDLRVALGRRVVLDGCSAGFGPGVTVLVGANGSGKSTLLRSIAGLVGTPRGAVRLAGRPLAPRGLDREHGSLVGYLPQEPHLPRSLTVREALAYSRWLHHPRRRGDGTDHLLHTHPPADWPTDDDLIDDLGLGDVVDRRLGELSGGMNRLAMLAVCTAHRPRVLLLDEATAGVDLAHRATFRRFLDARRHDTAVLLVSHVMDDIRRVADRVLVLSRGRFTFDGEPAELVAGVRPGNGGDAESSVEAALRQLTEGAP